MNRLAYLVSIVLVPVFSNAQVKVMEVLEIEDFGTFIIDEVPGIVTKDKYILASGNIADLTKSQVLKLLNEKLEGFPNDEKVEILKKESQIKRIVVHEGGYFNATLVSDRYDRDIAYALLTADEVETLPPTALGNIKEIGTGATVWWTLSPSTDFESSLSLRAFTHDHQENHLVHREQIAADKQDDAAFQNGLLLNCGYVVGIFHNKSGDASHILLTREDLQDHGFDFPHGPDCGPETGDVLDPTLEPEVSEWTTPGATTHEENTATIMTVTQPSDEVLSQYLDQYLDSIAGHDSLTLQAVENMEGHLSEVAEDAENKINMMFVILGGLFGVLAIGIIFLVAKRRNRTEAEPVIPEATKAASTPTEEIKTESNPTPAPTGLQVMDESGVFGGGALDIGMEASIGRSSSNDLTFPDSITQVSRSHAKFVSDQDRLSIIDLGSSNGTFVNDVRLEAHTPVELKTGDVIHLGKSRFSFKVK